MFDDLFKDPYDGEEEIENEHLTSRVVMYLLYILNDWSLHLAKAERDITLSITQIFLSTFNCV